MSSSMRRMTKRPVAIRKHRKDSVRPERRGAERPEVEGRHASQGACFDFAPATRALRSARTVSGDRESCSPVLGSSRGIRGDGHRRWPRAIMPRPLAFGGARIRMERRLLSGDEAVAAAARDGGVHLGTGYPGTPSTEILEAFHRLGGRAQWAPNEKVALEVGLGAAFGGARALVTMKHVGLNVAADPLFTAAYTGVSGAPVVVSADDPGMASSQNEQDNRHYAAAAGLPMLEPADSQEAYGLALAAFELSERWQLPVLLRMTTRVCHGKSIVARRSPVPARAPAFQRDIAGRVMIPAYARPAHKKLRRKLEAIATWAEPTPLNFRSGADRKLGIVTAGVTARHAREAAPAARFLELKTIYPLPLEAIRAFAA